MADKILKPFAVTIECVGVVMAEDRHEAYKVARNEQREIMSDVDPDISVGDELKSEEQLKVYGWDGMFLPYGGDGQTRLKDIFAALDALLTRDTKTVDMFEAPGN